MSDVTNLNTLQATAVKVGASKLDVLPYHYETIHFFIAGTQTAAAKKAGALMPFAGTIVGVRAYLDTAPTGSTFIADLNKNGTTMFTTQANRPTIAISGNASSTTLPDVVSLAAGDRLTFDVDQIGSSVAGADLYVSVLVRRQNQAS
jgi:uncharacterized protein YggE